LFGGVRTPDLDYPPLYTSTDQFYRPLLTTYPVIAPEHWRLTLVDVAGQRTSLTLADLRALPAFDVDCTICGSTYTVNEPLMSTARWQGIPLQHLLPGTPPNLRIMSAHGRFAEIPQALAQRAMLAYRVNGRDLQPEHGAPLRMIVPGADDRFMPGWVRRIELMSSSSRDVSIPDSPRRAVILEPQAATLGTAVLLGGYAYAGVDSIDEIALRVDDGDWLPLDFAAGAPGVWSRWRYRWQPQHPGIYQLQIRASAGDRVAVSQRSVRVGTTL
jgi:DMSO/TMAO reductase YedYZ molybdopterin-dependent catalytic subunit